VSENGQWQRVCSLWRSRGKDLDSTDHLTYLWSRFAPSRIWRRGRKMSYQKVGVWFLRAEGFLLIALGLVHLVATPHIAGLLKGSSPALYRRAVGPMVLNHVLVGSRAGRSMGPACTDRQLSCYVRSAAIGHGLHASARVLHCPPLSLRCGIGRHHFRIDDCGYAHPPERKAKYVIQGPHSSPSFWFCAGSVWRPDPYWRTALQD